MTARDSGVGECDFRVDILSIRLPTDEMFAQIQREDAIPLIGGHRIARSPGRIDHRAQIPAPGHPGGSGARDGDGAGGGTAGAGAGATGAAVADTENGCLVRKS